MSKAIAVVEDDESIREMLRYYFQSVGYAVRAYEMCIRDSGSPVPGRRGRAHRRPRVHSEPGGKGEVLSLIHI